MSFIDNGFFFKFIYPFYIDSDCVVGHFTQLVRYNCNRVGCAASTYTDGSYNYTLLTCNYSYTNIIGTAVYIKRNLECKTGPNPKYPGLCSTQEEYDATK